MIDRLGIPKGEPKKDKIVKYQLKLVAHNGSAFVTYDVLGTYPFGIEE